MEGKKSNNYTIFGSTHMDEGVVD